MSSPQGVIRNISRRNAALLALCGLLVFPCSPLPIEANAKSHRMQLSKIKDVRTARIIEELLSVKEETATLYNQTVSIKTLLPLYKDREFEPLWVKRGVISPQGAALLDAISKSEEHGLETPSFGLYSILLAGKDTDKSSSASMDMLITHSAQLYLRSLMFGLEAGKGKQNETVEDVLSSLSDSANPALTLANLTPTTADYKALAEALASYRSLKKIGGWPAFTVGKKMEPGKKDERITTLRRILTITGDLAQTADTLPWKEQSSAARNESLVYDATLQEAVKHFQSRHGLEPDGTLGKETQQALAVPVETRIDQMSAALYRMRAMPHDLGKRYVMVNIPGYGLKGVEDGKTVFESEVIVGKTSRRTPQMHSTITNVSFNPSWGVPERIARQDILPKIQDDPDYLSKGGFKLYDTEGGESVEVDPESIDWSSVDRDNFSFRLRQPPGSSNALGKIKFFIEDADGIYLHSTSQPKLFAKAKRALSSGCVRVKKPKELAQFILAGEKDWDEQKISAAYDSSASRTVSITPLSVHIVYLTSWVDADGKPHFADDVYKKDEALIAALKRIHREGEVAVAAR